MKKNVTVTIFAALVLLSLHVKAFGGQATATASVSIISAISNNATRDLSFGEVAIPLSGIATVILSPEEKTSISGNAHYNGEQSSARFEVTGIANSSYNIVIPDTVQISKGSGSLTLKNFTHSYGKGSGTIKSNGEDVFYVGASLEIPEDTVVGFYSGTFNVTVDY